MQTLDILPLPTVGQHVLDEDITAAVELFFPTKKGVPSYLMDVATNNGTCGAARRPAGAASRRTAWA